MLTLEQKMQMLNRVPAVQSPQTYPAGSGDVFSNTYYDTLAVPAGAGKLYQLFTEPQSTTKHVSKTNMTLGGQFPLGTDFIVERIGLRVWNTAVNALTADEANNVIASLFASSSVSLKVSGKEAFGIWPMLEWLGTFNTVLADGAINSTTTGTLWKDMGSLPIVLQAQAQWSFRVDIDPAVTVPANLAIRVLLWGTEMRTTG